MAGPKRARSDQAGAHRKRPDGDPRRLDAIKDLFGSFSEKGALATGSPWAFVIATASLVIWAASGPIFHFSDTWQLAVNTATTIVTFVMVFIIQAAQIRDTRAIQIKLDEVLKVMHREAMIDIEDLGDSELERLQKRIEKRYGKMKPRDL